jgi:hypothetical protein
MCPINFVFMSCKVKKQESPEYYSVENSKTLGSHLNRTILNLFFILRDPEGGPERGPDEGGPAFVPSH